MKSVTITEPTLVSICGLEDQGIASIAARIARVGLGRGNDPVTVVCVAEQRRKDGTGIKAGPTQPIDGAVAANQRSCLAIADEGIVLDGLRHGQTPQASWKRDAPAPSSLATKRPQQRCQW